MKTAISQAIKGAHRNGKEVGLCGQAPSDKPDFAGFLVDLGIDSISLTPDSVLQAIDIVSKAEMKDSVTKDIGNAIAKDRTVKISSPSSDLEIAEIKSEIGDAIALDKAIEEAKNEEIENMMGV